ncbi:hypothetical protein [Xanthomonas sp. BRIP62418]|uniref:hypothetical protein n=1 Tax=Xanthomonas sp. BRIP62418 TaxID=2182391 RepID=UPI000F8D0BDF|nr:hypothetical protein [Xanthomonas sp. BRIP62418]
MTKYLHEHQLDLILRETLIHAGASDKAQVYLRNRNDLATLHNAIRGLCNKQAGGTKNIYLTLHRLGHQQLPHQDRVQADYFGRYWALFRLPPIESLIRQHYEMSSLDYFTMVAGMLASYTSNPETDISRELLDFSLPEYGIKKCLRQISTTPTSLRRRQLETYRVNESWEYAFQEINLTPLIRLRSAHPDLLHCPRPQLLVRRLLAGAFFDLVNVQGYSTAFGDAVEMLAGDLIAKSDRQLNPVKPSPYPTSAGIRHGSDWILSDGTAHVFVECKSARIQLQAKVALSIEDVTKGMQRLANAIIQNYANIADAEAGVSRWHHDGLPIFSIILTLEDWILFSPIATQNLRELVVAGLAEKKLRPDFCDTNPYVVVAMKDIPNLTFAMAKHGIATVIKNKTSKKFEQYLTTQFLQEVGDTTKISNNLFKAAALELLDEIEIRFKSSTSSLSSPLSALD